MEREKAYLVTTHIHSFRPGIPAEIIGVEIVKLDDKLEPRICYHIRYSDMIEDWVVVNQGTYKIITLEQILKKDYGTN